VNAITSTSKPSSMLSTTQIAKDTIWKRLIGPSLMISRMFIPVALPGGCHPIKTKQGRWYAPEHQEFRGPRRRQAGSTGDDEGAAAAQIAVR
jgi:hypothetical protein